MAALATIFGGSVAGRLWGRGGREWWWCGGGWIAAPASRVLELPRSRLWRELVKRGDRSSGPPRCKGCWYHCGGDHLLCPLCVYASVIFPRTSPFQP